MPSRDSVSRSTLRGGIVGTVLFIGTVALYARLLGYGFTNYDDPRYITNNPHVQGGFTVENVRWAFVGNADYWHPLTWLSHMFDWQLYGANAAGHHLTSVLWHAANAVLAFVVLRRLTGAFWTSAFAAAVFAWHPLRVESVAWITERKDVMSGAFFLLTIWAYVVYAERRRDGKPSGRLYATTLALFAAGLMCKPSLVSLPLLLFALDRWPLRRIGNRAWVLEKVPFFALSAATALATIRMQQTVGAFTLSLPVSARLENAPVAIARYIGKFFWPTNLTVCYPHPGWWPASIVAGAIGLTLAVTFATWRFRERLPSLATGWAWFLAMLLPMLGLIQVGFQAMADRYTYVPGLGLELATLWAIRALSPWRGRTLALVSAVGVLIGMSVLTLRQEVTWRDSETLFRHAVAVTPHNDFAEAFLGYTLMTDGKPEEAVVHCQRALAIDPRNDTAVYTLALLDAAAGRQDAALAGYRRTLELRPDDPTTRYEFGLLLLQADRTGEAGEQLREAARQQPGIVAANARLSERYMRDGRLSDAAMAAMAGALLEPKSASAHYAAGQTYARIGREQDATRSFETALALDPRFVAARVELGFLSLQRNEPRAAAADFRAALAIEPELVGALTGLGRAEEQLGHTDAATAAFEHALQRAPDDGAVLRAWAEILARREEFAAAIPFYRRAIKAQPNDAATHAGLGFVLFLVRQKNEAIAEWKEALRLEPNFPGLRERLEKVTR